MKRMKISILLLMTAGLAMPSSKANAASQERSYDRYDYEMFYDDLGPYGEWVRSYNGVLVWRPIGVHRQWRPYSEGRWAWTDNGWYWVSYEPFGWAVFHYGRWSYDWRLGWVWVPDRVWGPAWVEWRYNDSYIGWAPLPPQALFHVSFGIRFSRPWSAPHHSWCFVDYRSFGTTVRYRDLVPSERVQRMIGTTRRGSGYSVDRDRVVNRGVERSYVQQRSTERFERIDVRTSNRREERLREGVIESYRPERDAQRVIPERRERTRIDNESGRSNPPAERPGIEQRRGKNETRPQAPDTRRVTPPSRQRSQPSRTAPDRSGSQRKSPPSNRSGKTRDN